MERAPERPAGVPAEARWLEDVGKWELCDADGEGRRRGPFSLWRPDGTLYMRGEYADGMLAGRFELLHPNGQLAREGRYVEGELDGAVTAYGSDAATNESLRACCVPPGAWQMKARWERGRLMGETFFDRAGRQLLSDGSPRPERPASVPESAQFEEWTRRWATGEYDAEKGAFGLWRYFTVDGRLDEEAEYHEARKCSSRQYDAAGAVWLDVHFEGDNVRHGGYRRRYVDPADSPWADARIREERGAFEHGQAVGPWTFHDESGALLRALDRGRAHRDEDVAGMEVLRDDARTLAEWRTLAGRLRGEGRVREAICAAARAAAGSGDARELTAFLDETTIALGETASARACGELADATGESLAGTLGALVGGAEPATVLRTLASSLKNANLAARDLVEAAILLAPERAMTYLTRALIRIELGDPEGALADGDIVARESADTAEFLRNYVRLLFPEFGFWPGREIPYAPSIENMPDAPAQPLEAVRQAIQVYATRLGTIRETLRARLGGAQPWLPPDVSALLPDGPVELRSYAAQITDETEEGPEVSDVQIEEALALEGWTIPALMRLARTHWNALCWLCWSAGLDRVVLPVELSPPANFAHAAGMAIARTWRAQDAVVTGGLRSMTAGVPGFVWEELDIDGIPKLFAEMAFDEYLEMRSVILYLASPENLSPFQSDLRAA
jgi:antitoxin component YwqK of YwqJK toxin-antitoxin module